jgi:uncharacterized protein (DUF427 family)
MAKAIWNDTVIAESDKTIIVEGNHYFPPESVNQAYLRSNDEHTVCHWKGEAGYYDIVVNGETNPGAAWYYPQPKNAAKHVENRIAFWRGVKVVD